MIKSLRSIRLVVLVTAQTLAVGCAPSGDTEFESADTLTPGIFLEPEERFVLPPGVEIRPVFHKGINLTKVSEGFRSRLYNDAAGYCTIAYGHLLKKARCDGTEPKEFKQGVTEPRGTEILGKDMNRAEIAVMRLATPNLSDGQYGAVCDFVFNVGSGNLTRSTLLKVVNARQYDRVPFQFRRWIFAGGKELPGLKARREKEIALFFEGIGIPRAAPLPDEDLTPIDIRTGEVVQ